MSYDFVPANLAIKAMRANGFKSTDYAVSELIDNSIQAGLQAGQEFSEVEVICIEKRTNNNGRLLPGITEIIIADSAGGMAPDVLRRALMFGAGTNLQPAQQKGIGKFGMGLPNASISQCKLVEVYSWQNGECYMTSLDVNKIENGEIKEVPEPQRAEIPDRIKRVTNLCNERGGTIVVWSNLDKTTWIRHQAFFKNSEFLVGRMYRKFLSDNRVKITFKAYESHSEDEINKLNELNVRPNDPLMLMTGTSAPAPYNDIAAFEELGRPHKIKVDLSNGITSEVEIKFSVASKKAREQQNGKDAGNLPHGKYAARNVGVSIVRADRELELNTTWVNPGDLRERWWGVEINFQPELDDIFGVTNNKQAATNLFRANIQEDADNLGIKQSELQQELYESADPKLVTYQISQIVDARLTSLRTHIRKQNSGTQATSSTSSGAAERRASLISKQRAQGGQTSESDEARAKATAEERADALAAQLVEIGADPVSAGRIAIERIQDDVRFSFSRAGLSSPAIFDISQEFGEYLIKFNDRHPAFSKFIRLLDDKDTEDSEAFVGLKLLLCAWTRMEDEAIGKEKESIQDIRLKWGQIARNFMSTDD
ncbi:ATP-binding protein [bacterium]|nr:ATP-binding protein [bacterium]